MAKSSQVNDKRARRGHLKRPTIRYPLIWLAGLGLLAVLLPLVRPVVQGWVTKAKSSVARAMEGPPVPSSAEPQTVGGVLVRKGLLLREGVEATDRPYGKASETIGKRMFVDFYDVWPLTGEPTHVRVGNRRAFGWVRTSDVLPWDTRLVVTPENPSIALSDSPGGEAQPVIGEPETPLPVVGWGEGKTQLAVWTPGLAWQEVSRKGWSSASPALLKGAGVWLSRGEVLALIRLMVSDPTGQQDQTLRTQAILGTLTDREAMPAEALEAANKILPGWALERSGQNPERRRKLIESLARLNENWKPQARWSGLEFLALPLELLP